MAKSKSETRLLLDVMPDLVAKVDTADLALESEIPTTQSEPDPASGFDLNISLSHLLHRAQQVGADLHVAAFGPSGLTQRQVAVLVCLGAQNGVSQTELVTRTGIDRSTLAEMVARMEAKGLVARARSATDSRVNTVTLTQSGQEALDDALPKLEGIDAGILAFLPAGRREKFVDLLTRIVHPDGDGKPSGKAQDLPKSKKKDKKKGRKKNKASKA